MKQVLLFPSLMLFSVFISCGGPAAEDRDMMHAKAKVFQDSIANVIRTTIAEAEGPAVDNAPTVVVDTTKKAGTASSTTK